LSAQPFADPRDAARALFVAGADLDWRSGQFAGGIAYADRPLTDRQLRWLAALLSKAGLPPLAGGNA
jgi:hypothetical protein